MSQLGQSSSGDQRGNVDTCKVCREPILNGKSMAAMELRFHPECFLCHQCLEVFPDGSFYRSPPEDAADECKLYCENDYYTLYGDRCARCGELITDTCVNALDLKWHAHHFTCDECGTQLAGTSFMKRNGRPFCKDCCNRLKAKDEEQARNACPRCRKPILPTEPVFTFQDQTCHAHHFSCVMCKRAVEHDFKELEGKLYCPQDYARATAPLCYVCRKPIYGRSIHALGRTFHPEHFVCTKCEQPFQSSSFREYQGKPYCENHYNEIAGSKCSRCYKFTQGRVIPAASRKWCETHFSCIGCDKNLALGGSGQKYLEWDAKIMCMKCYTEIPSEIRRRLNKYADIETKAATAKS